ncbi:MAG: hypothetical protein U0941_20650 [Planctomycetaceae bacterium]
MAAPVLQALLVADHIYQDQATGKFVICGIFGTIFFLPGNDEPSQQSDAASKDSGAGNPTGPESGASGKGASGQGGTQQLPLNRLIRAGSPSAYVSLTEVHGQRSFELRYVDLNENNVIFTFEFQVECRNPLETVQMTIPLPVLPVPHEGVFALELVCEGELLGSHRILTKRQPRLS